MTATSSPSDAPVDLSNCDREPIHLPGSIQPHGALLAVQEPGYGVVWASDSCGSVLGVEAQELLGSDLRALLPPAEWERVHGLLATTEIRSVTPLSITLPVADEMVAFDLLVHRSHVFLVCELERAQGTPAAIADAYQQVQAAALRLASAPSVELLARAAAHEIRGITGYDRVMVYRFDADWNGEVIAEEKREDLNPFLGLHYPATDIPAQARALYLTNWIRMIADVAYAPSALRAADGQEGPLDLSFAVLRSVSPIHIEYLQNMGVSASMSISLIVREQLWGLIACHHYSGALQPPHHVRAAAEFIGQNVSLLLAGRQDADTHERALAAAAVRSQLLDALRAEDADLMQVLLDETLLTVVGADGVAVRLNGEVHTLGVAPADGDIVRLAEWIWRENPTEVAFATDALAHVDQFAELRDVVSGVLAAAISASGAQWILWFRRELVHTVDWGGDPKNKILIVNEDASVRLSPRRSFERWKEIVRGRSAPWEPHEVAAAGEVGRHLTGILLRRVQEEAEMARSVRRSLSPEHLPQVPRVRFAAHYVPGGGGHLGGDWFDAVVVPDGRVAVALGDVAGHGMVVAAKMSEMRASLRAYLVEDPEPAAVLERVNRLVSHLLPDDMATAVVALLDPVTGQLDIASAGHLPLLLINGGRTVLVDAARGPALGVLSSRSYEQTTVQLAGGGTLVLFSDGLVERRGMAIDVGLEALAQSVRPEEDLEALAAGLVAGADPEGDDDVALLAVRWDGPS